MPLCTYYTPHRHNCVFPFPTESDLFSGKDIIQALWAEGHKQLLRGMYTVKAQLSLLYITQGTGKDL